MPDSSSTPWFYLALVVLMIALPVSMQAIYKLAAGAKKTVLILATGPFWTVYASLWYVVLNQSWSSGIFRNVAILAVGFPGILSLALSFPAPETEAEAKARTKTA